MEIRELVWLKKGTGGLEPPENMGILMDRKKTGKEHIAVVYTLRGPMSVKWSGIKDAGGVVYTGDKRDKASMMKFLSSAIDDERKGLRLKLDPRQITEECRVKDLHQSVISALEEEQLNQEKDGAGHPKHCLPVALAPERIARIHYRPNILDPKQYSAVKKVLSVCDDPAVPFFHMINRGGEQFYLPFDPEAISAMRSHINRLEELKSLFVEHVEEENEDGKRYRKAIPIFEDPSQANLDERMDEELELVCAWAENYLKEGGWPTESEPVFGLNGTPVRFMDEFDLERWTSFFAHNMIGAVKRHLPSDLVGMLLKMDKISWAKASRLVVNFNLESSARDFRASFPDHVRRAAGRLEGRLDEGELEQRRDLRSLETYTIDPPDAKDFDDAVSIEIEGDRTILWVHIADVTHYVRPGDLIDGEARQRGTSVYLPTGVLPMLPAKLSEDLCSLKERTDRLALSTRMVISNDMEILGFEHYRSIINVDRNLSYESVNEWIDEGKEPFTSLWDLAGGLERSHERLGLETPERKVIFPDQNSISMDMKRPTKATRMIEQFMVVTNEAAARRLRDNELTVAYRVHPLPDAESVKEFNHKMEALDIPISIEEISGAEEEEEEEGARLEDLMKGGKITLSGFAFSEEYENHGPEEADEKGENSDEVSMDEISETISHFNAALKEIDGLDKKHLKDIVRIWILRTMPRAFYSDHNIGHFGLNSECYCHFTSPIRRYPDILVHRAIAYLIEQEEKTETFGEPPGEEEVSDIMEHVNEMSDQAEEWEREMIDVAVATRAFMDEDFRKGKHSGFISSITPSMLYISLDDGFTEGSLPVRSLSPGRLHLDDSGSMIIASFDGNEDMMKDSPILKRLMENQGKDIVLLKLGDHVTCSVHDISVAKGQIGLSIMDNEWMT